MEVSDKNMLPTLQFEKQPDVGNKNICKIMYFILRARALPAPALHHVDFLTGASEQDTSTTIL